MSNEVILNDGRKVSLSTLMQTFTYNGLLEGVPQKFINDRQISWQLEEAKKMQGSKGEAFLIEPLRTDYLNVPGDLDDFKERHKNSRMFGNPECLPSVTCAGVFVSLSPTKNHPNLDGSSLTILWYQERFAMPIDPGIVESIQQIDWDSLATDFEY